MPGFRSAGHIYAGGMNCVHMVNYITVVRTVLAQVCRTIGSIFLVGKHNQEEDINISLAIK